jgi:uncharacterized protein (UPF0335 family)
MAEVVDAEKLRSFIERIERLNEEKDGLAQDIREVFKEAKAQGFNRPTMRKIIALRKLETHVRDDQDELLHSYREALGMTPIEQAIQRSFAEGDEADKQQRLQAA